MEGSGRGDEAAKFGTVRALPGALKMPGEQETDSDLQRPIAADNHIQPHIKLLPADEQGIVDVTGDDVVLGRL